jgi:hypothetical protein
VCHERTFKIDANRHLRQDACERAFSIALSCAHKNPRNLDEKSEFRRQLEMMTQEYKEFTAADE